MERMSWAVRQAVTIGTDSFDEVGGSGYAVSFWKLDGGDVDVVNTECGVATLTEKMHVCVVVSLVVVAETKFIQGSIAAVLNGVDEVFFTEEGECPEDAGLIEGDQPFLEFSKGERTGGIGQSLNDDDSVGCRSDVVLCHHGLVFIYGFVSHVSITSMRGEIIGLSVDVLFRCPDRN